MTDLARPGAAFSAITVRRLQPTIGAETGDVDLAQHFGTAERDEIKAQWAGL